MNQGQTPWVGIFVPGILFLLNFPADSGEKSVITIWCRCHPECPNKLHSIRRGHGYVQKYLSSKLYYVCRCVRDFSDSSSMSLRPCKNKKNEQCRLETYILKQHLLPNEVSVKVTIVCAIFASALLVYTLWSSCIIA